MIDFTWSKGFDFDLNTEVIEGWINDMVIEEGFTLDNASVVFCSDAELLEMNIKHLNHDYFTDIITFDYSQESALSGDLFISVDRVEENAKDRSLSFIFELNRVIVHGFLHLCGYGDKSSEEEKLMRGREDFYLSKLRGFT